MMWVNPHSWLNMDVPNADGTVENWAVEFSSPGSLYRRGWKTRDLFVGTDIVVEGYHARDKSPTAAAITVTLAGWTKPICGVKRYRCAGARAMTLRGARLLVAAATMGVVVSSSSDAQGQTRRSLAESVERACPMGV